jgi:hypothetical protein
VKRGNGEKGQRHRLDSHEPTVWLDKIKRERRAAEFNIVAGQWATLCLGMLLIGVGMTLVLGDAIPRRFLGAFDAWRIGLAAIIATVGYLYYRMRIAEPMSHVVLLIGSVWLAYGLAATFWF